MKKFLFGYMLVAAMLAATLPAFAIDIGTGPGGMAQGVAKKSGYSTNVTQTTLSESIGKLIKTALSMVGTIFIVLTIYAGIIWMTAGGNEEKVETAQKIIKAATLGLVIVVAAYGITVFVIVATLSASGGDATPVGGAGANSAGGFWKSFGSAFSNNWSKYVLP